MPTIAFFNGIAVKMNFREHPPPHCHVFYANGADLDPATLRKDIKPVTATRSAVGRKLRSAKAVTEAPATYQTKPTRRIPTNSPSLREQ